MAYLANVSGGNFWVSLLNARLSVALLGLCMAGLALPTSAQSPTAADVDRMLAEFDVQHQRTLELIEEAKAALKPASAFAHLPPDAVPLEPYLGKGFVSVESGFAMQVNGSEQGALRVSFVNIDATPVGGFLLGAKQSMATATYTLYDIGQIAFGDCVANGEPRTASVNRDGSGVGFGWSCGGDRRGRGRQYYSYTLEPEGLGIKTKFLVTTDQGVSSSSEHLYLPMTEELLAAAAARLKERHEEEQRRLAAIRLQQAEQERERRRLSQERVRSFNRAMEGISGVLNDAVAEVGTYDEAQERLNATVADIQYAANVESQQRALAAQQEQARAAEASRQQLAENARWVAEKEQAAAEYRSGQTEVAAAREAQLVAQQQAGQQRRAASETQRRGAEQAAAVERQRLQAAALAERPNISARPVAAAPAPSQSSGHQTSAGSSVSPKSSGPIEMFAFFINLGGKTVAFEGPTAMTVAEGNAKKARLAAEAPGRYGAGATVKVQSMGNGYCAFVYQLPGKGFYVLGSDTNLSTTIEEKDLLVKNSKAVIHHDEVCPTNN